MLIPNVQNVPVRMAISRVKKSRVENAVRQIYFEIKEIILLQSKAFILT